MYRGGRGGFGGGRGGGRSFGGGQRQDDDYPMDDNDERLRKVFIAKLSYDTTEDSLKAYMEQFGTVESSSIAKDGDQRSRGFGFVTFADSSSVDNVQLKRPHKIDGKDVETKRPLPKDEDRSAVNKVFIGGCNKETDENAIREAFQNYGQIEQIDVIKDKNTGNFKGYCFVTFQDTDSVDKCVIKRKFDVNGKTVDVKKAQSKDREGGGRGRSRGGRGGYGGGMYGGSGGSYGGYGGGNYGYDQYGYGGGDGYDYGQGYGGDAYNQGYGGAFGSNYGDNYYGGAMKGGSYNRSQPYNRY